MNKAPAHEGVQAVILLMRAKSRLHERLFDRALEDLAAALRLNPRLGDALMLRASIWVQLEKFEQALQDVEARLQIDPPDPIALLTRGNLRAYLGQSEPALADFTAFLEQQPTSAIALQARAQAFSCLRRFEEAIADLNAALAAEPDRADTYLQRGRVYQDAGRYPAALADYQKALDHGPDQAGVHNQFAWMLAACPQQNCRDGARAVQLARRACELTRWEDANLIDTLACAHAECGQFDEALRFAERSLANASAENKEGVRRHVQLFQNGRPARFETGPASS